MTKLSLVLLALQCFCLCSLSHSSIVDPYPARPTPLPELPPLHSSVGFSLPAHVAKSPNSDHPPPPLLSIPGLAPESAPAVFAPATPPCAAAADAGEPVGAIPMEVWRQRMWCVAKPSVPEETLQEAMDYACGEGGGDCTEIMASGSCYYPTTVTAHASYAFNSYWQKNKRTGGSCSFGGTAMLISADPSFMNCIFPLI